MASSRLYRNYTLDEDAYNASPKRTSSPKEVLDSPKARRVPRASGSGTLKSPRRPSAAGMTVDDDAASLYGDESEKFDQRGSYFPFSPIDSATAFPSDRTSDNRQRDIHGSSGSLNRDRAVARGDRSSPPPTSAGKPLYRTGSEIDDNLGRKSSFTQHGDDKDFASPNSMPDFFSLPVFQVVLRNPAIAHQLLKFSRTRFSGEHMEFLAKVNSYHLQLHDVSKAISAIYEDFFADGALRYLNVPQTVNEKVKGDARLAISTTLPSLESVFAGAQKDVERMIYGDIYPQFVRNQMSVSAAKALGSDPSRYAGLGDCFVLTDPKKADNPIVFASDGFVKVTGYARKEIIPRNCRFLQGQQTDRAAVQRIGDAINQREESVELLLNQKKNGEPFWNLLYVTPLFGHDGDLVFFLGGQINCSTTIHSTSDVLRILALSRENEEDSRTNSPMSSPRPAPVPSRSIRRPFGSNSRSSIQQRAPGMETDLVNRMGNLPLTSQFREFYTAYSNFIVVNNGSFLIAFVSGGIIDLLFPIKAKTAYNALAVGTDIFKFLANHGSGPGVSWDFKSSVKNALKIGQPISVDLKLCAKPSMELEKFILHWTPLKDESGMVKWIVITLGNEARA